MRCERGQATIEWVGLVLLASLALGALATAVPAVDGRSFGGASGAPDRLRGARVRLRRRSGRRASAPTAPGMPSCCAATRRAWSTSRASARCPVDWRRCRARAVLGRARRPRPGRPPHAGRPARPPRSRALSAAAARTYLQYWLYYPDSNTAVAGLGLAVAAQSAGAGRDPAGHRPRPLPRLSTPTTGRVRGAGRPRRSRGGPRHARTATGSGASEAECRDRWGPRTGWTRVSRGSHAGHVPAGLARRWRGAPASARVQGRPPGTTGRASRVSTCASGPPLRRAAPRAARKAGCAAATGRWSRTCCRPGASLRTATRRARFGMTESACCRRPEG